MFDINEEEKPALIYKMLLEKFYKRHVPVEEKTATEAQPMNEKKEEELTLSQFMYKFFKKRLILAGVFGFLSALLYFIFCF